jgi:carboxyl-terminal processing protease
VILKVRRGAGIVSVEITRGLIAIPTINAVMLPDNVGYVQVTTFQEDTALRLLEALDKFQAEGELAGLVVDLRGNSGGLLAQAVGILNQFVTGGELVIVRSAKRNFICFSDAERKMPLNKISS